MGAFPELAKKGPISSQFLKSFGDYVAKNGGGTNMYLHNEALEVWYAPVKFEIGRYNSCHILPGDKNPNVLTFESMKEANAYAGSLMEVLRGKGFKRSKVRGEKVYVRGTVVTNWTLGAQSQVKLSEKPVYLIRLDIRK